jgi:hypothetical protein
MRCYEDFKMKPNTELNRIKDAVRQARAYLDSFIETESCKDHYIESTGEYENCQIDFSEAQKALDLLGSDDDYGIDTGF